MSKKHLIIIGARGYGREVYDLALGTKEFELGEWDVKGFLDEKTDAFDDVVQPEGGYPPILGPVETYDVQPDDVFICALGEPKWRKKYAGIVLSKGGCFISIIGREASVSNAARIGKGCIIGKWVTISGNVTVEDFTVIHAHSILGHDVKIGTCSSIEAFCFFGGYSEIGEEVSMHVRSAIIPHKKVGNRVSVGFGSVVMRNFGDDVHLFGNPAKKIEF